MHGSYGVVVLIVRDGLVLTSRYWLYRTNKDVAEYNAAMLRVAEAAGAGSAGGRVSVHNLHGVAAAMASVSDSHHTYAPVTCTATQEPYT